MRNMGIIPPIEVKLSCIALTEPLEAAVVAVAQSAEVPTPKRASFPSILPRYLTPSGIAAPTNSNTVQTIRAAMKRMLITFKSAIP